MRATGGYSVAPEGRENERTDCEHRRRGREKLLG